MYEEKQQLRREIARQKKLYSSEQLQNWSDQIMSLLEQSELFRQAHVVACYHALPGEVQTAAFLERWYKKKRIVLPVVQGDDLLFFPYAGPASVQTGAFGITEPIVTPQSVSIEKEIDLIIVPGVAFDRQLNRMGRGKGFYDRLLSTLSVPKIGIGYSFQLQEQIPTEDFDKKMDLVITEHEIIGLPGQTNSPNLILC